MRTETMKFAVIGLGLFGKKLALELANMDHQVLAIDKNEQPVSEIRNQVNKAVIGDASQNDLLDELVTPNLDALIITLATNIEASLLCVLHAQKIGIERIIVKSKGPDHTTILRQLGITEIIMPEEDVAHQLAKSIGRPRVFEYLKFQDNYSLMKMVVPDQFVEKNLIELDLRKQHGVQVIGVQTEGTGEINFVPRPDRSFNPDDVIWITGPDEILTEFSKK